MNKKIVNVLLANIFVMGMLLTACGGKEEVNNDIVPVLQESVVEDVDSKLEENITDTEQAPTEAIVSETEEAAFIPEGVDINSSLPGEEWIALFDGVVEEPVVVVFNDTTGRKEVIFDGEVVNVNPDTDRIGVYYGTVESGWETTHNLSRDGSKTIMGNSGEACGSAITLNSERMREIPERDVKITVNGTIEYGIIVIVE